MSWVAHDVEPYVVQRHLGRRVAFTPLLIGSYAPDLVTKWFVYGVGFAGYHLEAEDPAQFHRGWPGVGFTHSLAFGVAIGFLIYMVGRNRVWAVSFVIGQWAHALTDTLDTLGTMLFFPFSTELVAAGAWAYAGQTGRYTDAGAYFSGLGFVWDGIWLLWAALSWRVLTRAYFRETVMQADPFWRWAGRSLSETVLIAVYRAAFFYGACRWVAWLAWAHLVRSFAFDFSWGGPKWVPAVRPSDVNTAGACKCPSCTAASPKLVLYGAVAVAARIKRLQQHTNPKAPLRSEGATPSRHRASRRARSRAPVRLWRRRRRRARGDADPGEGPARRLRARGERVRLPDGPCTRLEVPH
jgi:membrane-bound metal-dependent hydrolase YbcI (DUF457 family)